MCRPPTFTFLPDLTLRFYDPFLDSMPDSSKPVTPPPTTETAPVPLKTLTEKFGALTPHDSVATAGARMREHDAPTWPVTEDQKLVGMVDQKDPDWKMGGHGHDPRASKVRQIMNREVVFCYEDEDCVNAQKLMEERDLRFLPVVDRQMRIVGIFSREEIQEKVDAQAPAPADSSKKLSDPSP